MRKKHLWCIDAFTILTSSPMGKEDMVKVIEEERD